MQVVFDGEFVATNQPQAVDSPWYIKDRPIPQRDVEKAKKLLAAAGVSKPSFTLSVTQNPVDGQIAQVIQSMAGEAGFDVKVEVLESNTLTGNTIKGVYDAATVIWSGRTDPDGNISFWLACDGFLNWGKYCNKDVDAALAAARSKVNPTERLVDYTKAAHIYLQERPHLFLFNHKWIWGLSAKMDGFVPNPDGIIRLHGVKLGS
jgi:peptide/nickel transport system substrate-binding protein